MVLENIYKNSITFNTQGNVEFRFTDNKSQVRYLLDIIIDNNIIITNVLSLGTFKDIGSIINNSGTMIGINLDNAKLTLIMTGTHVVDIKIKQGIFIGTVNSVPTVPNYSIQPGYSFNFGRLMATVADKTDYITNKLTPLETNMLETVNSLLATSEEMPDVSKLYDYYYDRHDNIVNPKYAYISNLNSTNISIYISELSIDTKLYTNNDITLDKLDQDSQASIALANSAVQEVYINKNSTPEIKTKGLTNLNLSDKLGINLILSDKLRFKKKDTDTYYEYEVNKNGEINGETTIEYANNDIQSKILPSVEHGSQYFISYSNDANNRFSYSYEAMDEFFKKSDLIKEPNDKDATDDLLYSALGVNKISNSKVDKLTESPDISNDVDVLSNIKVNDQGLVTYRENTKRSDLTGLILTHYQRSGVKKVVNTPHSTIFFM